MKFNSVFHIGEGTIKFLQASVGLKKALTGVEAIAIDNQDDAQISRTLIQFIKDKKINIAENRVTVLIPRSRAILRYMVFPSQNQDEIRSMVDLQIGSRIPYAREEVEVDFQILSKTADGYSKVAVVIIPQEIVMRYWKIFSDAKIPVHGITITSIGLWLLYQQQPGASEKPSAIIDLDSHHSEICLCQKSHWLNSREIPIGFTQISNEGNEEMIKQWELTQVSTIGEKISGAVEEVYLACSLDRVDELAAEMAKAQSELSIKKMIVTQSLSLPRGLQWPPSIAQDGASIASLAGIAFNAGVVPIDLIPRSVRQAQAKQAYQHQLIILGAWAAAALISLILASGMGFFKKNMQLARLQDELRTTQRESVAVEKQLKEMNEIESAINSRLIFSDLAAAIDRLLPAHAYLVSITVGEANSVSLEGMSFNPAEINEFQNGLVRSKNFSNVTLNYVNKRVTQQGEVNYFKITCTFKPVRGQQ